MRVPPFINRFLTIFLLVALPVQSCPAVAVLLCQDNLGAHATEHRLSHHESHANQQSSDLACDDCVFCHLSISYNTPVESPLSYADLSRIVCLFSPYHFYLFIPEQPQHPPQSPHV
jgi:hypothetical protein